VSTDAPAGRPPRPGRPRPRATATPDRLVSAAQRRLAITTLVVLAVLITAVGLTTAILAGEQLDASVDQTLQAAASTELARLHEANGGASTESPKPGESESEQGDSGEGTPAPTRTVTPTAAPALTANPDDDDRAPAAADTFFLWLDSAGTIVRNPERVALPGLPDPAAAAKALAGGRDLRTVQAGAVRIRLLTLAVPSEDAGATQVTTLQAGFVLTLHDDQLASLLRSILMVGLGGLLAAALASILLTRRALGPVRAAFARERRFVAAASHELRTPIALIRSSAEVLAREGNVSADGEQLVLDIVSEADRLGGLVAELSDLAVAQARPPESLEPVDLAAVAADVARRARPLAEAAGLWLEAPSMPAAEGRSSRDRPRAPVVVRGDRDRILQVALILIDTAIRHTPSGGVVRLTVRAASGTGELSVSDEGPGIPPADRERIFEPFARLGTAGRAGTGSDGGGSGLGLSIARAIVTGLSGAIRVDDAPGKGSVFTISLPLA
jgi:signal transduction histidine kinase